MASPHPVRAYLDYNATAPMRPEAKTAVIAAMDHPGNPSSIHWEGRGARAIVEEGRRAVAEFAGGSPRGVVFTASGTEAANLVLSPTIAPGRDFVRLVIGASEHPCVLQGHRFPTEAVSIAPLAADGRLDLAALTKLVDAAPGPVMLALQGANNETGVLQPVAEAATIVHAKGGFVVCDAVQMAGRTELSSAALNADFIFLSAHKFGGPKGAGALVATRGEAAIGAPLLRGGGQERGARAGTENVAAIAGFGVAARLAGAERVAERARLAALRDALTAAVLASAPDAAIFGALAPRLPNTLCFAVPGIAAATLVIALDLAGVAVSAGSACSSGKVTRSHVLEAMGVAPDLAGGAIRLSLGWASREADVARFAEAFAGAVPNLRRRRGAA
jgi:cysteine desulfurase